jgi:hypothetical protein
MMVFLKKIKETYEAVVRRYKLRKEGRGWRWALQ